MHLVESVQSLKNFKSDLNIFDSLKNTEIKLFKLQKGHNCKETVERVIYLEPHMSPVTIRKKPKSELIIFDSIPIIEHK